MLTDPPLSLASQLLQGNAFQMQAAFFPMFDHRTQKLQALSLQLTKLTIQYILSPQAERLGQFQK
jgi:hypothetical protein